MSCFCSAGLFSGELVFRGAYYWKEFCVSKWVGLDNKNSLKHYKNNLRQLALNSPWAYTQEGLLLEGFLRLRFGGAYFREGLFFLILVRGGGGRGLLLEFYVCILAGLCSSGYNYYVAPENPDFGTTPANV